MKSDKHQDHNQQGNRNADSVPNENTTVYQRNRLMNIE